MDLAFLQKYTMEEALTFYKSLLDEIQGTAEELPVLAELGKQDRFFLFTHILKLMSPAALP